MTDRLHEDSYSRAYQAPNSTPACLRRDPNQNVGTALVTKAVGPPNPAAADPVLMPDRGEAAEELGWKQRDGSEMRQFARGHGEWMTVIAWSEPGGTQVQVARSR